MQPLRYSINITLDGCCDHREGIADAALHRHHEASLARADAMLLGRVTYQMMEGAWREPSETGTLAEWMEPWMMPFARTIGGIRKYVVSGTLQQVGWNSELVQGDLESAVRRLKQQPGRGVQVGGVTLPFALAELGLIDEYEFVVQPRIAGHGPTLLDGLSRRVDLSLVGRSELESGAVVLRYVPK